MARFLSPEWVAELNAVMEGSRPDPGPDAGLAMADGRVVVVQEVHGAPDGDVRLVMTVEAGAVHLELGARTPDTELGGSPDDEGATVTIIVAYADAAAMAQGRLTPAEALNAGPIRVRGDLAALAAAQQILNEARSGAEGKLPVTTY